MRQYVCLMALGTYATFANAFTDIASSVLPVAQGMMQNQQAGQAAQQQQAQAMAQIQVEQNQASQALTQAQSAEMANMAAQEKKGYPILDPFARGTYWAMRDTQFKTSMAIAAKRSELETKASKEAIDREFQATQQMITAVGGLMKTAGEQVQKLGQANASAAASAKASQQAQTDATDASVQCNGDRTQCVRTAQPTGGTGDNRTCASGFTFKPATGQCEKPMSSSEISAMNAVRQQEAAQSLPAGCTRVQGHAYQVTCGGQTYSDVAAARSQMSVQQQVTALEAEVRRLEGEYASASESMKPAIWSTLETRRTELRRLQSGGTTNQSAAAASATGS